YADEGSYTVTVAVKDDEGTLGRGTAVVTVADVKPAVNAGWGATLSQGGTFASSGSFTDPSGDTWTATVAYGDGSGLQPLTLNADKSFSLSYLYGNQGNFTVTVSVKDNEGTLGTSTTTVTVVFRPATISGRVFQDINTNGAQDSGERGIAGQTIL